MAREETLKLLGDLIDKLQGLGGRVPGQTIRSADWNSLVDAVRTVAQVAVARERTTDDFLDERYARAEHQHLGQVGMSWFDPSTRALLEENINGSVVQRAAIESVRGEMAQLRTSMDGVRQTVDQLRLDLDGLRDSDAARGRNLDRVAVRVENLRDVETRVTGLDQRLGSISSNVEEALAFRNELVDETGAPINVGAFGQRITELEGLRQNLTMANGSVVQIRELEQALARLEENAITRPDIDNVVAGRLRDRGALEAAGLFEAVGEGVRESLNPRFAALDQATAQLTTDVNGLRERSNAHDSAIGVHDTRLVAAEGQIRTFAPLPERLNSQQTLLTNLETRIQSAQQSLSEIPTLRADITRLRGDMTRFSSAADTITGLQTRITSLEANTATINQLVTSTGANAQRLAAIEQSLPELRNSTTILSQHTDTLAQLGTRMTVNESQLNLLSNVPQTMETLNRQVRTLNDFQTFATQRLNDLGNRTAGLDALTNRVVAVERLAAETRNDFTRVTDQVTGLDTRLNRIDTGTVVTRPPLRPIG